MKPRFSLFGTVTLAACAVVLSAMAKDQKSEWQNTDPNSWNGNEVYQILNNSPWSKTVKTSFTNEKDPNDALGGQNSIPSAPPPPSYGGGGGYGRRGGYGNNSRTYSSGGSNSSTKGNSPAPNGPTEVTIQWQSALPVQIAAAKKAAGDGVKIDLSGIHPLDSYVVAVIGLPVRALGGRAASVDSDQTTDEQEAHEIEERLKRMSEIVVGGHEIHPNKVELDQGADGRTLLYFSKAEPITLNDKTVEVKLVAGHTKVEKKFNLKDMEYKGQLEL